MCSDSSVCLLGVLDCQPALAQSGSYVARDDVLIQRPQCLPRLKNLHGAIRFGRIVCIMGQLIDDSRYKRCDGLFLGERNAVEQELA